MNERCNLKSDHERADFYTLYLLEVEILLRTPLKPRVLLCRPEIRQADRQAERKTQRRVSVFCSPTGGVFAVIPEMGGASFGYTCATSAGRLGPHLLPHPSPTLLSPR